MYDRASGQTVTEPYAKKSLRFLYHTLPGRAVLKLITAPWVSRVFGKAFYWKSSRRKIDGFVARNGIELSQYEPAEYGSFGDFFVRKIRPECRPIGGGAGDLIAVADSKLLVHEINDDLVMNIKQSAYSVAELVGDAALAAEFVGGLCLVFRLAVDDYHRYCFFDDGRVVTSRRLPGKLHTVTAIAFEKHKVFCVNTREVTVLDTEHFGRAAQIEVGALMVARIVNHSVERFKRGQEKGYFEPGGSTVVVLLKKEAVVLDGDIIEKSKQGIECRVRFGELIGKAKRPD